MDFEDKVNQLERTILELGTEVFRVRTEMSGIKSTNDNFMEVMKGLQQLLDEKGLVSKEDFENAVGLGQALSFAAGNPYDPQLEEEMRKLKKTSH